MGKKEEQDDDVGKESRGKACSSSSRNQNGGKGGDFRSKFRVGKEGLRLEKKEEEAAGVRKEVEEERERVLKK